MTQIEKVDWNLIQKFYDSDCVTWNDIRDKFKVSISTISKAAKQGLFKSKNRSLALSKRKEIYGVFKHTQETKDKISKARKKYLIENPDKVPYLLNHIHKKQFYSETFFKECLLSTNFTPEYRLGNYSLDFVDLEKKVDLEIDGEQHFVDARIIEHDKKRNEYVLSMGFTVIRVRWSKFQRLDKQEKSEIVSAIIENRNPNHDCILFLVSDSDSLCYDQYLQKKEILIRKSICKCGGIKCVKATLCAKCRAFSRRKERPNKEALLKILESNSFVAVGKMFGVSDNSIRKWVKS